jgi:hypothetical protein
LEQALRALEEAQEAHVEQRRELGMRYMDMVKRQAISGDKHIIAAPISKKKTKRRKKK